MIRSGEARGPGIFFILPCIDEIRIVDLRTVTCMVDPQEILTKDSVTVQVDAVVYHRVDNPLNAIIKVSNYIKSTQLLAASTLRNVLGTKELSELLSDRESVARIMQDILDEATHVVSQFSQNNFHFYCYLVLIFCFILLLICVSFMVIYQWGIKVERVEM